MAPRGRNLEPGRLFDAVPDPIYVVDERRRLTFVNAACAQWVGRTADELVGSECRYRSDETADPLAALADALCPPPSVFTGRRASTEIVLPATSDRELGPPRRADFVPLGVSALGVTAVLVWLPSAEIAARDAEELARFESEAEQLHATTAKVRRAAAAAYSIDRLIGDSPAMRRVRSQIAVAASTTANLTITGPAGSGRGRVARAVHYFRAPGSAASADAAGPLIPLDGRTLGPELVQSTVRTMMRTARESNRRAGTLLIDDADHLSAEAQLELAALTKLVDPPPRLMLTVAEPPARLADAGRFRRDLAELSAVLTIEIPPLARRAEDIPLLAQQLLEQSNVAGGKQLGGFAPEALDRLALYGWPGEVEELAKVVDEAAARADGPLVTAADLPPRLQLAADAARYSQRRDEPIVLDEFLEKIERELIRRAVDRAAGNKTRAAKLLGVTRPRLYRRMVQLGLETGPVIFEEADDESREAQ